MLELSITSSCIKVAAWINSTHAARLTSLNPFSYPQIFEHCNVNRALSLARTSDQQDNKGILRGVPFAIKDHFQYSGSGRLPGGVPRGVPGSCSGFPSGEKNLRIRPRGYFCMLRSILILPDLEIPLKSQKIRKTRIYEKSNPKKMSNDMFHIKNNCF